MRDPQILFRGRGGAPDRVEKRWSIVLQGPRAEEAGSWFPRAELGEGEWLWVWKWSPNYESEFAGLGEWAFTGLAPRRKPDGSWVFEGAAPELSWLRADGSRLSVLEEDARGVLRVLESTGDVSLFALQRLSESGGASSQVIQREKSRARPWLVHQPRRSEAPQWRNLVEQEGGGGTGLGLGLLPVYLLAAEIRSDPQALAEMGMRRVVSLILSSLDGREFELRRAGQVVFRVSRPAASESSGREPEEISGGSESLSWSMRGPAVSQLSPDVRARLTKILESLGGFPSTGAAAPRSPG
jgi:hypothetical protein